jgi:DNA-binding transcriptional MerR regulator
MSGNNAVNLADGNKFVPDTQNIAELDGVNSDYMRIGDVAKLFDVTLRTLRFYEDKGMIVPKRVGVTRLYSRRDRARIKLILLGKKLGFSLRDVKQLIDLYEPRGENRTQLQVAHQKSLRQLDKLHSQKLAIEEAIDEMNNLITTIADRLQGARAVA